jgi:hypothetical protein
MKRNDLETVGDLREFLKGLPDDMPLLSMELGASATVILIDRNGNARQVTTTKRKWLQINISININ